MSQPPPPLLLLLSPQVNSSTYPVSVKAIDLCATGCDPNKGCGLNGMNTKGVSTQGGKWPLNQGQECAYKVRAACSSQTNVLLQPRLLV